MGCCKRLARHEANSFGHGRLEEAAEGRMGETVGGKGLT